MLLSTTSALGLMMLTAQMFALPNMIPQNALAFHGYGGANMQMAGSRIGGYPPNIKKSDMLLRFGKRGDRKLLLRFGRVPQTAYDDLPQVKDDVSGYNSAAAAAYGRLEEA